MAKVNTVVAKALAERVVKELKTLRDSLSDELKKGVLDELKNDPLVAKFEKAQVDTFKILNQLKKKYNKINWHSDKSEKISNFYSSYNMIKNAKSIMLPSVDDIKNDIILSQASTDKFDAEKFIAKLVKDYSSKLNLK